MLRGTNQGIRKAAERATEKERKPQGMDYSRLSDEELLGLVEGIEQGKIPASGWPPASPHKGLGLATNQLRLKPIEQLTADETEYLLQQHEARQAKTQEATGFEHLSDEELIQIGRRHEAAQPQGPTGFEHLSDDELRALVDEYEAANPPPTEMGYPGESQRDQLREGQGSEAGEGMSTEEIDQLAAKHGSIKTAPSRVSQFFRGELEWTPENVGSVTGGAVGSLSLQPGPAVGLAAVGGALGRGVTNLYNRFAPGGARQAEPRNLLADMDEAGRSSALSEGVNQVVGLGAGKLLTKLAAPLAAKFAGGEQAAVNELAKQYDIPLTASQQTGSRALSRLEGLTEKATFGSEPAESFRKSQVAAVGRNLDDLVTRSGGGVALPVQQAGETALTTLVARRAEAVKTYGAPFRELLKEHGNLETSPQNTLNLIAQSEGMHEELGKLAPKFMRDLDALKFKKPAGALDGVSPEEIDILRKSAANNPTGEAAQLLNAAEAGSQPTTTFRTLRELETRLGDESNAARRSGRDSLARGYGELREAVKADIDQAFEQSGNPQLVQRYRQAKEDYKLNVIEPFKNQDVRKLLKTDPSKVLDVAFTPGGSLERLDRIRGAVGKEGFEVARASWLKDQVAKSADTTGELSIQSFLKKFAQNKNEDPYFKKILGEENFNDLTNLRKIFENIQASGRAASNSSGTAQSLFARDDLRGVAGIVMLGIANPATVGGALAGGALGKLAGGGTAGKVAGAAAGGLAGQAFDQSGILQEPDSVGGLLNNLGLITLTTVGLGRLMYSKQGIQWLTKGLTRGDLSAESQRIAKGESW